MVSVRLEDTVGESCLLLGYESLVERVANYKLFDLALSERDRVGATLQGGGLKVEIGETPFVQDGRVRLRLLYSSLFSGT